MEIKLKLLLHDYNPVSDFDYEEVVDTNMCSNYNYLMAILLALNYVVSLSFSYSFNADV